MNPQMIEALWTARMQDEQRRAAERQRIRQARVARRRRRHPLD